MLIVKLRKRRVAPRSAISKNTVISRMNHRTLALLLAIAAARSVAAEPDGAERERLSGDWGGSRPRLAERGVALDFDSTHYYQGLMSGTGEEDFDYGGRIDVLADFDTTKLGWWDGGIVRTHTEYLYGDLDPTLGGTVVPTNLGTLLPKTGANELTITTLHIGQQLNERLNLIAGKINTIDLIAADPFFGGAGHSRFMNLAFAAPANGLLPPVIMGGILSVASAPLSWTFMLFDPNDRSGDYWIDDLFEDGVNVSASARRSGLYRGRTSSITFTGIYGTKDGADLGELLLPPELRTGDKSGSYHVSVQVAHFLRESAPNAADGWGVFAKIGMSDGNPNPYEAFITGGIGGKGLFPRRPNDGFGLGYFYYDFSDVLQSSLDPLAELDDESGIEAYYSFSVRPWLLLTVDLQYVDPVTATNDDALIGGVRAKIRF